MIVLLFVQSNMCGMGDRFREDRRGGRGCCGLGVMRDAFKGGVMYTCE